VGIVIKDNDDNYTTTFKTWCVKLHRAGIDVNAVARGIEHLEEHIRDSVRTGNEVWPPSYAEFIGHCHKQTERASFRDFKRLPNRHLSNDEQKGKMREMREKLGI